MNKKDLTETDIRTKFITPAILGPNGSKWNVMTQVLEERYFTKGRIIVRGKTVQRGEAKKADYILFYKPNIPIAVVEAKDNNHSVGAGMQQALDYAETLDVPFAYSSNGDGFVEHDRTGKAATPERDLALEDFPTANELWSRYRGLKGYTPQQEIVATQDYYTDPSGKAPHYFQQVAINRTVDAIARGENRVLLVMATGTGKTYTAFQIIWRLWKAGVKKRILFLVDRNILADQTKINDFKPFGTAMTKITNRTVDKSYEIYLSLYQAVTGTEEEQDIYKEFSPDFFDLVIVDECHRGSAAADASWRRILDYFSSATQIGMTATPKETKDVSNIEYFGEPIYTYSLRQGIEDGFLAPYKVIRIGLDKDLEGWRPEKGKLDRYGQEIEDRIYNDLDFDQNLILKKRTEVVANKITEFLKATDRFAKTIVFCENIDHAERMRQALVNANADLAAANKRYVMRITGDEEEGKAQLDNFIDPESTFPVIVTTSRLMSTGVDAQTCKLIVLDRKIGSMTEFKQIIGRGTRINEDYNKFFFTIMDFKRATAHFADPDFDGDPVQIYEPREGDPINPPDNLVQDAEGTYGDKPVVFPDGETDGGKSVKYYVDDVEVKVATERVQYLDARSFSYNIAVASIMVLVVGLPVWAAFEVWTHPSPRQHEAGTDLTLILEDNRLAPGISNPEYNLEHIGKVGPFVAGDDEAISDKPTDGFITLNDLCQSLMNCLSNNVEIECVILAGKVDKREPVRAVRQKYGSNLNLAQQRARCVKEELVSNPSLGLASHRVITVISGADVLNEDSKNGTSFESDRGVECYAVFKRPLSK